MFAVPQRGRHAHLAPARARRRRRAPGLRTSYTYQLEAFAAAVRRGAPVVTDVDFSVANMTMIDAAYVMAGMQPRRPVTEPPSSVAR